jgi:putative ABC transport system ATP-binding protein
MMVAQVCSSGLPTALAVEGLAFRRTDGWSLQVPALHVEAGESVFLHGRSGSGKSTLLGLIAGTLRPDRGAIRISDRPMPASRSGQRDRLRAEALGVIFQQFNLLPFLSLIDNVTLPCRFSVARARRASALHGSVPAAARALLSQLDLPPERFGGRALSTLSVGQQQRVAAARALIGAPPLILADEPTSALDPDAREAFLGLILDACRRHGSGLLLVSHDHAIRPLFDRAMELPVQ